MAALFASQSLFSASTIMSFTLMPIIAARLGESDSAAGVPPTVMMLGRAVAAYPAGWMMDRLGRRPGLSLGYVLTGLGAALCAASVGLWESFVWFSVGVLLMGMGRGVIEQSRFVAAEIHTVDERPRAIGLIVLAGTVGAIGGPLLVEPSGGLSASPCAPSAVGALRVGCGGFAAYAITPQTRSDPNRRADRWWAPECSSVWVGEAAHRDLYTG